MLLMIFGQPSLGSACAHRNVPKSIRNTPKFMQFISYTQRYSWNMEKYMKYADEFYFSEEQESDGFGRNPPGRLSVPRLIKNQPCWRQTIQQNAQTPKALILDDWTANTWSWHKYDAVNRQIKTLINDGFTLYAWSDGTLIKLGPNGLSLADRQRMTPTTVAEITAVAAKQHLSADKIHVLDDYGLESILEGDFGLEAVIGPNQRRAILLSNLLHSPHNKTTLMAWLKQATPNSDILADELDRPGCINWLRSQFRGDPRLANEFALNAGESISDTDFFKTLLEQELPTGDAPELPIILQTDASIFQEYFFIIQAGMIGEFFRTLELSENRPEQEQTHQQLIEFLQEKPCLQHLGLFNYKNFSGILDALKPLPQLESLDFNGSSLTSTDLITLFQNMPKLRSLKLANCKFLMNGDVTTFGELEHLESLDLSCSNIDAETLTAILRKAPHLRKLTLSDCNNITGALLGVHFKHLESLDLSFSNCIGEDELISVFQNSHCIQTLNLDFMHKVNVLPALSAIKFFDQLDSIALFQFEAIDIDLLHQKAPKIRALQFNSIGIKNTESAINEIAKFEYLESFTLSHFKKTAKTLEPLLNARRLKTLELKNTLLWNSDRDFDDRFEHIESLIIDGGALGSVLAHVPNLHALDLTNTGSIQTDLNRFSRSNVASIQQLALPDDLKDVSANALRDVLNALPNLKEPSLSKINALIKQIKQKTPEKRALSTSSDQELATVTAHHSNEHMDTKPKSTKDAFTFKGTNQTKSQSMVIEKLSQYLTLTKTHTALIPHIQDGICNGLSYWFLSQDNDNAQQKLEAIAAWNGKTVATDPLPAIFDELVNGIKQHQLGPKTQTMHYVGDVLREAIPTLSTPCLLKNPWHTIALQPIVGENSSWIYDPNDPNGPRRIPNDNLYDVIQHYIGDIVAIESATPCHILPKINNINAFIKDGGLHALHQCANLQTTILSTILLESSIDASALQGLLLRNTKGVPAWVVGLKNPRLFTTTLGLLAQFMQHDTHAAQQLGKSLGVLSAPQRHALIVALHQPIVDTTPTHTAFVAQLSEVIRHAPANLDYYRAQLETWVKEKPFAHSIDAYCQSLVAPLDSNKKHLIELPSAQSIEAMQLALQHYCLSTSQAVFYVNTPDDLLCQSSYITRDNQGAGTITDWNEGPGSPLLQFIRSNQNTDPAPVIIVNYDQFKPADIVRFNALLEDPRKADGVELPQNMLIVGLVNPTAPHSYQGADFYSRMNQVEQSPFSDEELTRTIKPLPNASVPENTPVYTIHLCCAADWQERLLGRWMIHDDVLTFKDGELTQAIHSGLPIVIENGLWEQVEFRQFWQQAILHKKIEHSGGVINLPENVQFDKREGYDWSGLTQGLQVINGVNPSTEAMNPTRLGLCFNQLTCNNANHTANEQMGLLEAHAHKPLTLTITRSLSEDEWAILLLENQLHHVDLTCHLASGVTLPDGLLAHITIQNSPSIVIQHQYTQLIQSTDSDVTIAQLTKDVSDWCIIDVSECSASDLLQHINAEFDKEQRRFCFTETSGAVHTALAHNQNIILTGTFSPELIDELAPLLLKRQTTTDASSQLILVSDKLQAFHYQSIETRDVLIQEKKECLARDYPMLAIEDILNNHPNESLVRLKARLDYHRLYPAGNTDNAWQGVHRLDINIANKPWDATTSSAETLAFNQQRLNAVNQRLDKLPFVFLTGLTAVGKSTFVERYLSTENGDVLFNNISQARDWALSKSNGRPILFIDEANITSKQWSEFEGLFNHPPSILIDGTSYELSPEHKVVFAGNPLNYGDRKLPSFFQRHGNALVFDPLPSSFIYEEIIKPVYQSTPLETVSEPIARELLEIYQFLCEHAKTEIVISPRELQMMALLVVSYMQQYPNEDPIHVACHYRYQLTQALVPEMLRDEFEKQFAPTTDLLRQQTISAQQTYTLTPSRQAVKNQLVDWLSLSIAKRNTPADALDAKRYGGLGGLVIEGTPGIGKSELVRATLHELGFKEQTLDKKNTPLASTDKPYYDIPASMPLDEKKRVLLQAFHEGAVVLVDEINSSLLMEDLMNNLLMGKTPEKEPPQKPGFMIIGTQNPSTMAGRKTIGNALSRRLMTLKLRDYNDDEIRTILNTAGVPSEKTEHLVNVFRQAVVYAEKNHVSPPPTFRDLWKVAKAELSLHVPFTKPVASAKKQGTQSPIDPSVSLDEKVNTKKNVREFKQRYNKTVTNQNESGDDFGKEPPSSTI